MNMFKILLFINRATKEEFVVITNTPASETQDYCVNEWYLADEIEVEQDLEHWPVDQRLTSKEALYDRMMEHK